MKKKKKFTMSTSQGMFRWLIESYEKSISQPLIWKCKSKQIVLDSNKGRKVENL